MERFRGAALRYSGMDSAQKSRQSDAPAGSTQAVADDLEAPVAGMSSEPDTEMMSPSAAGDAQAQGSELMLQFAQAHPVSVGDILDDPTIEGDVQLAAHRIAQADGQVAYQAGMLAGFAKTHPDPAHRQRLLEALRAGPARPSVFLKVLIDQPMPKARELLDAVLIAFPSLAADLGLPVPAEPSLAAQAQADRVPIDPAAEDAANKTFDAIANTRNYVRKARLMLEFANVYPGAVDHLLEKTDRLRCRPENFLRPLLEREAFADRPIRKTAEKVLQEFPMLALRMNLEIEDTDEETLEMQRLEHAQGGDDETSAAAAGAADVADVAGPHAAHRTPSRAHCIALIQAAQLHYGIDEHVVDGARYEEHTRAIHSALRDFGLTDQAIQFRSGEVTRHLHFVPPEREHLRGACLLLQEVAELTAEEFNLSDAALDLDPRIAMRDAQRYWASDPEGRDRDACARQVDVLRRVMLGFELSTSDIYTRAEALTGRVDLPVERERLLGMCRLLQQVADLPTEPRRRVIFRVSS